MTWEIALFLAAAINGVILSLLFITSHTSVQKRFLGVYLLLFSIVILYYINYWTKAVSLPPVLTWICVISDWLMPAAFYYYAKEKAKLKHIPYHLIPAFAFTIYWITMNFFVTAAPGIYICLCLLHCRLYCLYCCYSPWFLHLETGLYHLRWIHHYHIWHDIL